MTNAILYPSLQEPPLLSISAPAETITVDKWWQPASEPAREVQRSLAALVSGESFLDISIPPIIQWASSVEGFVTFPRVTLYPAVARPLFIETPSEDVTMDKWWRQPEEPTRTNPHVYFREGSFQPDYARQLDAEFPSYDKWRAEYPDQHLVPRYPVNEGLFLADYARLRDAEFTFTTWWRQPEEPVRTQPFSVANGWFSLNEFPLEPITLDKWYVQHPEVHRVPLYPLLEGLFLPDYARLLDAEDPNLKWWMPAEEPVRINPGVYFREGMFEPDYAHLLDTAFPSADKWWVPASEPVRIAPHLLANGLWEIDSNWEGTLPPETITLDKWWMLTLEPLYRVYTPSSGESFVDINVPPNIQWASSTSGHVVFPRVTLYPAVASPLVTAPPEEITLDTWYVQPDEPLRVLAAVYFREGYFFIYPIPFPNPRGGSRSVMRPGLELMTPNTRVARATRNLGVPNHHIDRPGRRV